MKKEVGLWIDHREAVIVILTQEGEAIKRVRSDLEQQEHLSARASAGSPEDRRDQRTQTWLNHYYDEVIAAIRDADAMLLLGPGEAKYELEKRLSNKQRSALIVGVETVDHMTEPQMVAAIRQGLLRTRWAASAYSAQSATE